MILVAEFKYISADTSLTHVEIEGKGSSIRSQLPRSIAATLGTLLLLTVLFFVPPITPRTNYLASTIEKHKLLSSVPSPRIILVGGSNVAFGYNSPYIQSQTGLPVINMGLHAGLGLKYSLAEIKPFIRKSDLVILSPEYYWLGNPEWDVTMFQLLYVYPRAIQYIRLDSLANIPGSYAQLMKFKRDYWRQFGISKPVTGPIYNRFAFNKNGDVVAHWDKYASHKYFEQEVTYVPPINHESIKVLREFQEHCTAAGAHVFYSYPPLVRDYYQDARNFSDIAALKNLLESKTKLTVLGIPDDVVFEKGAFYDTTDHLGKAGQLARSAKLAKSLKEYCSQHNIRLPIPN